MNRNRLGELRVECPGASWAVWSEEFPADGCLESHPERLTEFVESRSDCLQPDVIIASLSHSTRKQLGYRNYHSPDSSSLSHILKDAIQDQGLEELRGAYLTTIHPESGWDETSPLGTDEADVTQFFDQLRALGQSRYDIVCLSQRAFDILTHELDGVPESHSHGIRSFSTELDSINITAFHVGTGADGDTTDRDRELLRSQLQFLNDALIE